MTAFPEPPQWLL